MKVLHYLPSIDRSSGGVGSYMQLMAGELGKLVDLHIATHASTNMYGMANSHVHCIPEWKYIRRMRRQWEELLDKIRPDIVHVNCCWMPGSALAQKWAQAKGCKIVLSPHGMLEPWIMQRHYWTRKFPALLLYQKAAVKRADFLHATAESEKDNLLKLGWNNRISVVANGVDVGNIEMKGSWKRTGKILFLSRVHPKKGLEFLIEAMSRIKGELQCLIAGEGEQDYIEQLKDLAKKKGVADRIDFLGGIYGDNKWKYFKDADVFVLPTYSENFGIVVAEALASGTPVITTTGTPWNELNTEHCGWWIDIGENALVGALNEFLSLSDEELEAMGRNGRRLVEERYSTFKIAKDMLSLYRQL
ncbi:MAG: glycosyltransferase [Prevotella sp.]|nr:glycosyltransferase [Prevotella sp.]